MRWTALHMLIVAVLAALPLPGLAACLEATCAMAALDEQTATDAGTSESDPHACCAEGAPAADRDAERTPDTAVPCCCDHAERERVTALAPSWPERPELDDLAQLAMLRPSSPAVHTPPSARRRAELRPLAPRAPPSGPRLPLRVVHCVWRC